MATDTSTSTTFESGDNQQRRGSQMLQHAGVFALLFSFEIIYASFIVAVSEVFAQAGADFPRWFDAILAAGFGIPVVVTLVITAYYTFSVVKGETARGWWRYAVYGAGVAAVVLPVFYYLAPQAAGAI